MDSATVSTKSTDLSTSAEESTADSNIIVKLRRLKIEENLLIKNVRKTFEDLSEDGQDTAKTNYYDNNRQCNKFKNTFIEIRDLFEEIRANIISEDNLQCLVIEEVKKNILNLENKIRCYKSSLQTQLNTLKCEEVELMKEVDESTNYVNRLNRPKKVQIKAFSEIVPSPVKNIINSPFKCSEVQEFQEFMANRKNRYGGWMLYNHEIFEKEWHKHFYTHKNIEDFEYQDVNVESSGRFQIFLYNISVKLPGIEIEDLIAHHKWYTKYLYLKERQKRALEKWRLKKRVIKSSRLKTISKEIHIKKDMPERPTVRSPNANANYEEDFNIIGVQELLNQTLYDTDILYEPENIPSEVEVSSSHDQACKTTPKPIFTYMNSTKQWNNRCSSKGKEHKQQVNGIENIRKRRVPEWRLLMQIE